MSKGPHIKKSRGRPGLIKCIVMLATSLGWPFSVLAEESRWINGSWVPLHPQPAADAPALLHVHTNQAVDLLSENGEWCEVRVVETGEKGYLRCEELGETELSVKSVEMPRIDYDTFNPDYSPTKAFWIDPSVPRLLHAGDDFEMTELPEQQWHVEQGNYFDGPPESYDNREVPDRPVIPEFEAMKAAMTDGIVAGEHSRPRFHHWATVQAKARELTNTRNGFRHDGVYAWGPSIFTLQTAILRPVTPSFFDSSRQLAPAHSGIDALSANFGIVQKIRITGAPKWVWPRHESLMLAGSWDIGAFDQYLTSPVVEHVIGRRGLVGANQWPASISRDLGEEAEAYCDSGLHLSPRAAEPLPDYPAVKDPLIWFYTAKPLPFKKAKITTHAQRPYSEGVSLIVAHEIDIDGDGVADLAAIEQIGAERHDWSQGAETTTSVGLRMFFANVSGDWYLIDLDEFVECT